MKAFQPYLVACVVLLGAIAAVWAIADDDKSSATDAASGLTVKVFRDEVVLKRSAKSTIGTDGASGQVACTDDYQKLIDAQAQPALNEPWYAATLVSWPGAGGESTARLSHELSSDIDLCVASTADSSAQVLVYFNPNAKTAIDKLQSESTRGQQASSPSDALTSAAQAAVATVTDGKFPDEATILASITKQGLIAKEAAGDAQVTEIGTIYVLADQTTDKTFVASVKGTDDKITTATQGVKGSVKIDTP